MIKDYNKEIQTTSDKQATLAQFTQNTNQATADLIKSAKGAVVSEPKKQAAINATTNAAKIGKTVMQTFAMAGNTLVSMAIIFALSKIVEGIDEFIHASERGREKSTELTQAWKQENDTINASISKYKELNQSLEDNTLSESEAMHVKEDLSSIQDSLNEKFKNELKDINLVTGGYEEQLSVLKELSKWYCFKR